MKIFLFLFLFLFQDISLARPLVDPKICVNTSEPCSCPCGYERKDVLVDLTSYTARRGEGGKLDAHARPAVCDKEDASKRRTCAMGNKDYTPFPNGWVGEEAKTTICFPHLSETCNATDVGDGGMGKRQDVGDKQVIRVDLCVPRSHQSRAEYNSHIPDQVERKKYTAVVCIKPKKPQEPQKPSTKKTKKPTRNAGRYITPALRHNEPEKDEWI
jgi:hypothetical protein